MSPTKLLPNLGYGRIELIEVRIPYGSQGGGLPKAVEELRPARAYLVNGDWEKVVAHCRNTLETILDSRQLQIPATSKFSLKVDTFIEQHLSAKLSGSQAKLLAEEMKLLWEICSKAAHPTPTDFKRADANFIVQNTTDILQYVSGLLARAPSGILRATSVWWIASAIPARRDSLSSRKYLPETAPRHSFG